VSQREGDYVRITATDGGVVDFTLVPASRLYEYQYNDTVAKIGSTLKFSRTFTATDYEFGGTISVPVFKKLSDITTDASVVLIDNPAWLSVMVAAGYVLSDAQLTYQYGDLIAQATELMNGMKQANNSQDDTYCSATNFFEVGN
jgi:hypothetical protein